MGLGIAIRLNDAPDNTVAAAAYVEIQERIGHATLFSLEYVLDIGNGDLPLLNEDKLGPGSEISVLAPTPDGTACLVKGPVFSQQIHLHHGGEDSSLVVIGADSLIKLDREDKAAAWADQTDSDAVSAILSQGGFTPDVDTTSAGHPETKHSLIQRETDLAFIRRLARRNGCLFWLTADEQGVETAHFKRPVLTGTAAAELVINLSNPAPNLNELDISWDVEAATQADATEIDLNNKSDISGAVQRSPLSALGGQALADIVTDSRVAHVFAPVDDSGDLQARSEAALIDSSFFVRATGTTTFTALGTVLRAHTLVNLRGAGSRHSGLWLCAAVRHVIDVDEYRMEFELIRNGWNSSGASSPLGGLNL
jgi:phage protein D